MDEFRLLISYSSGEKKVFDVAPYIEGSWYGELKNPEYFRSVHIISNGTGIEWANGQDIAPHELYDLGATV